jgi:hypothetical protein
LGWIACVLAVSISLSLRICILVHDEMNISIKSNETEKI